MPRSDKTRKAPPTRGKSFKTTSKGDAPKDHLPDRNYRSVEPRPGIGDPHELPDVPVEVTQDRSVKELKGMLGKATRHVSIEEMNAAIAECAVSDWRAGSTREDSDDET